VGRPHHAKDKRKQTMRSESDDVHMYYLCLNC
jgi:hypothetical protein